MRTRSRDSTKSGVGKNLPGRAAKALFLLAQDLSSQHGPHAVPGHDGVNGEDGPYRSVYHRPPQRQPVRGWAHDLRGAPREPAVIADSPIHALPCCTLPPLANTLHSISHLMRWPEVACCRLRLGPTVWQMLGRLILYAD